MVMALQVIAIDNDPASLSLVATCLGAGLVAFVSGRRHRRRPDQPAHDHHRGRDRQSGGGHRPSRCWACSTCLKIWHLAVASGILGIAAAFFFPAYSALLPRILPPEQLLAANGVEGVVRPVFQRSVGPARGGPGDRPRPSLHWAPWWWRCCSASAWSCWSPPARQWIRCAAADDRDRPHATA